MSHCVEDDGYKEDTLRGSLCLKLWMRQKSPGAGGTEIGGDLGQWVAKVAWEGAWASPVKEGFVSHFRGLICRICKCLRILGPVHYFPLF